MRNGNGGEEANEAKTQSLGHLLAQAHGLFRARMTAALDGSGLHLGHVLLLSALHAQNDLTQIELTRRAGIEKSSVVLFVDALEAGGWVERRPHLSDRRAHAVHLTDEGRARFAAVGAKLHAAQEDMLAAFDADERTRLESLLIRLVERLR